MYSYSSHQFNIFTLENKTVKQKIFSNPITRIILGLFVCVGVFIIGQNIVSNILSLTALDKDFRNLFKGIIASVLVISCYKIFYKFLERREIIEVSLKGICKNLTWGILIGATLQCLTILVIYLCNGFKIVSINPVSFIIIPLTVAFTVAIFEEILIRGILFRIMEEKLGSYITLTISTIVFGGLHFFNPNGSLISATCVAVEGGLLLGAAYIYARNVWLPIAIHFAWNFIQSGILGAITSGNEKTNSLLTTLITGSKIITGGEFGPEGTIQATIFCLAATLIFIYLNKKQNKLIRPFWAKKRCRNIIDYK